MQHRKLGRLMSKPPMKAIPTMYAGVQFRSRLEAKWAVFFDLLQWRWEYEPDIGDVGWIPDFILHGALRPVLVEVKPLLLSAYSTVPPAIVEKLRQATDRYECLEGLRPELLVVGLAPREMQLGWVTEADEVAVDGWSGFDPAEFGKWKAGRGQWGFCSSVQTFVDRISGGYDGGCNGEISSTPEEIAAIWHQAQNKIQWQPRQ